MATLDFGRALLAAAALVAAAEPEPSRTGALCEQLLRSVGEAGRSDFELAAQCRARLPEDACRNARHLLGSQPWKPENMRVACRHWEVEHNAYLRQLQQTQPNSRSAEDPFGVHQSLEQLVALKASLGPAIGGDRPDGPLGSSGQDLNSVMTQKAGITKQMEVVFQKKYALFMKAQDGMTRWTGGESGMPAWTGGQQHSLPEPEGPAPGKTPSWVNQMMGNWQQDISIHFATRASGVLCLMAAVPLLGAAVLAAKRRVQRTASQRSGMRVLMAEGEEDNGARQAELGE